MKNLILSIALFFLSFQVTFSQDLFSKEVDFSGLISRKYLQMFTMTHEIRNGQRTYEFYYLIFEVKNGTLDSVIFSENIHPKYLKQYQEHYERDYLERINGELKALGIHLLRDCKIYVPVIISFVNLNQNDEKLEKNLQSLFPINQTFDCLYIAKPNILVWIL